MIPISTTLRGIGPHSDTSVNWSDLTSPVAVTASYGTGKTFLVEASLACLWGDFAWYGGSIYDALSQGGTGEGSIELVFEQHGRKYRAVRTIKDSGKTRTQRAELWDVAQDVMVAGPKVTDFESRVTAMLGDRDTALSSWFLSQNRKNDLCGQPGETDLVSRRRATFNALIGSDALDAIEKRVGEEQRKRETIASDLEIQLAGEPDPAIAIEEARTVLDAGREGYDLTLGHVTAADTILEEARKKLRDAEGGDDVLLAQIRESEALDRTYADRILTVDKLNADLELYSARAAGLPNAQHDVAQIEDLQTRRTALREQETAWTARERWQKALDKATADHRQTESMIEGLTKASGVTDADRALAAKLPELRAGYKAQLEMNREQERKNAEWERQRNSLLMDRRSLEDHLAQIETRLSRRPETPADDAICATCPLMTEWGDLPGKAEQMRQGIVSLNSDIGAIPDVQPISELTELLTRGEQAKAAADRIEAAKANEEAVKDQRLILARHQDALNALDATRPPEVADPRAELADAQTNLDALSGARERLILCEEAVTKAERIQTELLSATVEQCTAGKAARAAREKAASAKAALDDRVAQRETLRQAVEATAQTVSHHRATMNTHAADIARNEAKIEALEERQVEQAGKRERAKKYRADVDGLRDLRQCFGPKGVRQILIDAAVPELEAIADALFERATGGRMRLRIATQTALRDGSASEDFRILVRDERGERDALRYSGGQLQLIQILFRISVAIWVGRIRGHQPDCLYLDEAFDRLGAEGTDDLLRVLEHLGSSIGLICVVTHDPMIAERLSSQVRLVSSVGGVSVETAGGRN
ncbi:SMC family ATPase [bacterium]|nr:SMC family ATPase [bacterium]